MTVVSNGDFLDSPAWAVLVAPTRVGSHTIHHYNPPRRDPKCGLWSENRGVGNESCYDSSMKVAMTVPTVSI